jgi:glycosyltransferase involved in cell wall biosynthesis
VEDFFDIYIERNKKTSGQRFFNNLYENLIHKSNKKYNSPTVILFNISAPLYLIVKSKLMGKKIILRVDSMYFDKLSDNFLKSFAQPIQLLLRIGVRYKFLNNYFSFCANFLNRNYGVFFRIFFADYIIFQSRFSQFIYSRYISKPYSIILNGSDYSGNLINMISNTSNTINLALIYDDKRPSKRIIDVIKFVEWANRYKDINLYILGYNGIYPSCIHENLCSLIEKSNHIFTYGKFDFYNDDVINFLSNSHLYITFSYRDACPNALIEVMALGLPVVGINSGGVGDIVGDAGILVDMDDFEDGFYSSHRFDNDFPIIDFNQMLNCVTNAHENLQELQKKVKNRFQNELNMDIVSSKYFNVINQFIY